MDLCLRDGQYREILFGVRDEAAAGELAMHLRDGQYRKILFGMRGKETVSTVHKKEQRQRYGRCFGI